MPSVPRRSLDEVNQVGLPSVRGNTDIPEGFSGGGSHANALASANLGLSKSVIDVIADQKKQADDVIVTDAIAKLTTKKIQLANESKNLTGMAAMDAPSRAMEAYNKYYDELIAGKDRENAKPLDSRQSALLTPHRLSIGTDLYSHTENYAYEQSTMMRKQADLDYQKSTVDDAIFNAGKEEKVKEALAKVNFAHQKWVGLNSPPPGSSKEDGEAFQKVSEARLNSSRSQVHMAVINQLLNENDTEKAQAHFDSYGKELSGKDLELAQKMVTESSQDAKAQAVVDELNRKDTPRPDALESIDKTYKNQPELRSRAKKKYLEDQALKDAAEKGQQNEELERAVKLISSGAPLPPHVRARLQKDDQIKVDLLQVDRVTDEHTRFEWEALKPQEKAALTWDQMTRDWLPNFSAKDREAILKEQGTLKTGGASAMQNANSIYSDGQMVMNSLYKAGLLTQFDTEEKLKSSKNTEKISMINGVKEEYNRQVYAYGGKITDQQKEKMLFDISSQVVRKTKVGVDPKALYFMVDEKDRDQIYPENFPVQDKRKIVNMAISAGLLNPSYTVAKAFENESLAVILNRSYMRMKFEGVKEAEMMAQLRSMAEAKAKRK